MNRQTQHHWVKCNFHAHARSWNGITNGHGTAIMINSAYKSLKYGVHCVSNYQNIDTTGCMGKSYISAYEHGYNINKNAPARARKYKSAVARLPFPSNTQ